MFTGTLGVRVFIIVNAACWASGECGKRGVFFGVGKGGGVRIISGLLSLERRLGAAIFI